MKFAATRGHLEIVQMLVAAGASIQHRHGDVPGTALASAVISGKTEVVRFLLSKGADPNELLVPDNKPLSDEAMEQGDIEIAELLRKYQGH